ncbi:MAG: hypothetical protein AAGF30_10470 [Pseudomonadota bacterium]
MRLCINDWNGVPYCVGSLMDQMHGSAPGGFEAGVAILLLLAVTITVFVFRDPA